MKLKYVKDTKFSYDGRQYRKGDILEVDELGTLPENWFEVINEESEKSETSEVKNKIEEVEENGDNKSTNTNILRKKGRSVSRKSA